MWLTILSDQLPVLGLVSHYLTNNLIGRGPLLWRQLTSRGHLCPGPFQVPGSTGNYLRFREAMPLLKVRYPRVTHRFAAIQRYFNKNPPEGFNSYQQQGSLDLHA